VANGIVYIANADNVDHTLYARDASTGNKLAGIQGAIPADGDNAVVVNGAVYIGGSDQQLHAFALP